MAKPIIRIDLKKTDRGLALYLDTKEALQWINLDASAWRDLVKRGSQMLDLPEPWKD